MSERDDGLFDEFREELAHISPERQPPAELEARVMAAALTRRPPAVPATDARSRRRSRTRAVVLTATAVAASVIVALLVATRDSSTPAPRGRIETVSTAAIDAGALADRPGARTGRFDPPIGSVVLVPDGTGALFDLEPSHPLVVVLEAASGDVVLGSATPHNATIAFTVNRPEAIRAVRVTASDGTPLGRAQLSE